MTLTFDPAAPRVTVIVATRDRRVLLGRALAGVDAQGFRDLELLVVDDGSTDGTPAWLSRDRPDVLLLLHASPRGAAAARNTALQRARGELIAFLDDDDVWAPTYLEEQVASLDAHPDAVLSSCDHVEVDPAGRRTFPDTEPLVAYGSPLLRMLAESFIHTMSVVVCRRATFGRHGLLDETLRIVHDLDWYRRPLAAGELFAHLARPLVERGIPGGLVGATADWFREERTVLSRAFAVDAARRDLVLATRSLYFGRVALSRGDIAFALARLAESLVCSPRWAVEVAARRLVRRARRG